MTTSPQTAKKKPLGKRAVRKLLAKEYDKKENTFNKFEEEEILEATGEVHPKVIKNKIIRRKPGTKSVNYFDETTQESIVEYQNEPEIEKKNLIYLNKIFPALDSLVENLINVYGFTVALESRSDLKNECLEFLYTTLPKFNAAKGSKAFSYFNVVAKNWLTIKSTQNSKKSQTYISIDNKDNISLHDLDTIENYQVAPDGEELMIAFENKDNVLDLIKEITDKVKTDNEKNCIRAISILLDNINDVDLLNKRAILLYLREISQLSSKQLSITLANLKKHYKEHKRREYA